METIIRKRVFTSLRFGWPVYNRPEELGQKTRVSVGVYFRGAAADLVSKSDVKIPSWMNL